LGIVILLCSFIILRTINPSLINERIVASGTIDASAPGVYLEGTQTPSLDNPSGLYYVSASQIPFIENTTLEVQLWRNIPAELKNIYYYCPEGDEEENLLVWKYSATDFGSDGPTGE